MFNGEAKYQSIKSHGGQTGQQQGRETAFRLIAPILIVLANTASPLDRQQQTHLAPRLFNYGRSHFGDLRPTKWLSGNIGQP